MNKIVQCRKALGYTQLDMAKKLNVSRQSYYRKEKGYVSFNDTEKMFLLETFRELFPQLTIDELFFSSKYKEKQRNVEEKGV